MPIGEVRIRGARELERAFRDVRNDVLGEIRPALLGIAEHVSRAAQQKAASEITNIGPRWQQMRVGVTARSVYVAPKSRRRGGSPRPNLGGLLMKKAMLPAVKENADAVEEALGLLVAETAARHRFL